MPDLMLVPMQMCASINGPLSIQWGDYTVSGLFSERHLPHCTCKGFKFRRKCRHIKEAQDSVCGWHQQFGESPTKDGACPRCEGPTVSVMVGT